MSPAAYAVGPIVADAGWRAVMEAADWRCQCAGGCGRTHAKEPGHRCKREHRTWCRLVASPAAPSDDPHRDLAAALVAYCPDCFDGWLAVTRRVKRRAEAVREDDLPLFDL